MTAMERCRRPGGVPALGGCRQPGGVCAGPGRVEVARGACAGSERVEVARRGLCRPWEGTYRQEGTVPAVGG